MQLIISMCLFFIKWIFIIISPFLITITFWIIVGLIKGRRFIKRDTKKPKKIGKLKRLFYLFPKQFVDDLFNSNPNYFNEFGICFLDGEQGSGKSSTIAWLLNDYKEKFPHLKIKTNMEYKYQDEPLKSAYDLMKFTNGKYGEIDVVDEVQNWFNTTDSANFPVELLEQLCQQRKQKKMMIFAGPIFMRAAKQIREQTYYLIKPICLFHCLNICRKYKIKLDCDGKINEQKMIKIWFFVQDKKLRDSYDTYKTVDKLRKTKFVPRSEQINNTNVPSIQVTVNGKK